ncbi:MAG TPA: aldo/keto reductase [Bryobacteraceae bacterium]|nr:aldo/keto reductase [Bryobacteraceae bacterium]
MKRREFLFSVTAAALQAGTPTRKLASDRIQLGPMKVACSRLAQGTGTNGVGGSSNQTRKLGLKGLADLLQAGYDQGITFWDSADQYGTHPHLREALKRGVPREKVTILTKTHASTESEMRADLDRFRRELGTDYIDILLLHDMEEDDWPQKKKGAMAVISEAREKGIVKTHGTSCHTLGALKAAAASPWVQVDLARINPAQMHMDSDPKTVISVLRQMKASGKGVIGMKILGAGGLRSRQDEALQYALALDCVDCFTIGSENRVEMQDLVKRIPAASTRG